MEKQEKLFNLSKNSKEDPPLSGFVEYFAYKVEERKYNIRYDHSSKNEGGGSKDNQHVVPARAFFDFVREKKYTTKEFYITKKQYQMFEFMNQVPEIVCDVLFYLSGYVHHRTSTMHQDMYKQLLMAQV